MRPVCCFKGKEWGRVPEEGKNEFTFPLPPLPMMTSLKVGISEAMLRQD
jgi:hypothetical protein